MAVPPRFELGLRASKTPLLTVTIMGQYKMVASSRFELERKLSESFMLPLHHEAIYKMVHCERIELPVTWV